MSTNQPAAGPPRRGRRQPLVLHQSLSEQLFWPAVLILAVCAALLIWNPPEFQDHRAELVLMVIGTGLILVLSFLFRLRSFAQCRADGLRIQSPFFHLDIPYTEIKATRPAQLARVFFPEEQRWLQRRFLRWLWGHTLVVVELERLPGPRRWLRIWLGPYLIHPDEDSLALPVRDWITFRAELDEQLAQHRRRRL